jgi:alkanesulfonate monooxygenase SsuD/methylene tetrahydromethanopterin reductase-like flavin-dependent oxidoreductase (luciferase family)
MRFGIILSSDRQDGVSGAQALADQLAKARVAQESGLHSVWAGPGYLHGGWHAALLLARACAEAPHLDVGMISLLPLHHPVELAEQIATLDTICHGRLTLAAALGWRDFQFRAFEVPQRQRLGRFREVLEVMHQLWTQERVTHHGTYFHLDDVPGARQPLQQPSPPIWIAANQDPGIVRAARTADGWLVSSRATIPTIERQAQLYRAACQEAGRPGYIAAWREMYVAEDKATAIAIIRPYVEWLYQNRAAMGHNRDLPETDRIDVEFEHVLQDRFIIGSPEDCVGEIERYQALGVQEIIVRCQWPGMPCDAALRALRRFGDEVLPRLRADGSRNG